MDESTFIAHFPGARRTGAGKYLVKCPAHDDGSPSLSLSVMPDGRKLARCFAGCEFMAVVAASGVALEDWFPPDTALRGRDYLPSLATTRKERASLEDERRIIAIAALDQEKGRKLSPADQARVKVAAERVRRAGG
ncbi:MAG: hypothetical protein ACRD0K_17790 [Egibacteraceae bacterium]